VVVVNYREQPVGPLLLFLLFVLFCLIGAPIWALIHFGAPHSPMAGKLLLVPVFGVLFLFLITRTLSFNARVRRDPRALQWDDINLSLWQNGRAATLPWGQVRGISVKQGKRASDLSFLNIATNKPGGRVMSWSFPSGRLNLAGQSLPDLANQLEQARSGTIALARPVNRDEASALKQKRVASARSTVVVVTSVYFVTLFVMIIYLLSSRTMLLTPRNPLLWLAAECAFFPVFGAWLLSIAKTFRKVPSVSWRVAASFLPRMLFVAFMAGVMAGFWAYLAANVYVTAKTWSGPIEHGSVMMVVKEPMITHHGRPTVEAHLLGRPGLNVFFALDEADAQVLRHWHDPQYVDEPACLTVPVQWVGYAIRTETSGDEPLRKGSLSRCP
jgi:hypothetical protein